LLVTRHARYIAGHFSTHGQPPAALPNPPPHFAGRPLSLLPAKKNANQPQQDSDEELSKGLGLKYAEDDDVWHEVHEFEIVLNPKAADEKALLRWQPVQASWLDITTERNIHFLDRTTSILDDTDLRQLTQLGMLQGSGKGGLARCKEATDVIEAEFARVMRARSLKRAKLNASRSWATDELENHRTQLQNTRTTQEQASDELPPLATLLTRV
jgi:hypothetical protein